MWRRRPSTVGPGCPARRSAPPLRTAWAALAACLVLAAGAAPAARGQEERVPAGPLLLHAYTFEHQRAAEALTVVSDLLSERGTVELQPGGNTLVIRDTLTALQRIRPVLAAFDRPSRELRLEIQIVEATSGGPDPAPGARLPEALARRLRELLRYERFGLVARAGLVTREGQEVTYRVGEEFTVSFTMGRVGFDERLKLTGFRLVRRDGEPTGRELLHTNLNLWLGEPMVLGLTRSEASDSALMVVLTCGVEAPAPEPTEEERP